jgi:hypothetical protein
LMARYANSYKRRPPVRDPHDVVLIVCEGGKTEPNYLDRLRAVRRLSSANIRITPADGTDPMSVVKFAEKESARGEYDRVFCIFDRDEHATYDAALRRVAKLKNFSAIISWPCFEIWLLLHFIYSAAPRSRDEAYAEVRRHYPSYRKGSGTVFDDLSNKLDQAIQHAKRLMNENSISGSSNPATLMHELVEYLMKLRT